MKGNGLVMRTMIVSKERTSPSFYIPRAPPPRETDMRHRHHGSTTRTPSLTWSKLASPRFPLRSGRFWGGDRTRSAEIQYMYEISEKNGIHIPSPHTLGGSFSRPVYPPFSHLPVQHFSRRTFFPPQSWPGLGTRPGQTSDAARTPLGDLFTPSSCALVCLPRWRRMTPWVSFPAVHWPGTRRWATKVSVFPRAPHRVYTACGFSF
jgi:hypothetical protein